MTHTQTAFVSVNGAEIYTEIAGDGPAVVLVHAGVADSRMWDDQFDLLAQNYRVLRYDMRGYGKSKPVDMPFAHREDLYALMQHFGMEKAVLVGTSIGGRTAMDVALEHPAQVTALVMVCSTPSGFQNPNPQDLPIFDELEAAEEADDIELLNELEVRLWYDGRGRAPDDVNPEKRALMLDMNRIALDNETTGLGEEKPPLDPPAIERLNALQMPVLVIVGGLDLNSPEEASNLLLAHVPDVRKVVIPNTAHIPSMDVPDDFNKNLLPFLERITG